MNRLGVLKPTGLNKDAQDFYDVIYKYLCATYPNGNLREDGALLGPFATHLHTPLVGQHFHGLGSEVERIPGFSQYNREIAILTAASKFRASYAISAHLVKGPALGFTRADIDTIMEGKMPDSLNEEGVVVYKSAYHLVNLPGSLPQDLYDKLIQLFGRDGTKHFIHLMGFYSYLMVVLNGFDVRAPEEETAEN
ncbi:AhpD-like protein [Xylariales sp. PMI_506]|nr:AhpD-like protein [Xylariales sp. PMI_506]